MVRHARERRAGHDARGDAGDGLADHLGDEGHRARGARVHLEDVDRRVGDRQLVRQEIDPRAGNHLRPHDIHLRFVGADEEIRGRAARFARRPRVYFEEWDEPMISGIRWVSELIEVAGLVTDAMAARSLEDPALLQLSNGVFTIVVLLVLLGGWGLFNTRLRAPLYSWRR